MWSSPADRSPCRTRRTTTMECATASSSAIKRSSTVDTDEGPRRDTTVESLAKLRPAFPNKQGGNDGLSVTAGNSSSLNDGAAAVVVTSEDFARAHGLEILARIDAYATGATEP